MSIRTRAQAIAALSALAPPLVVELGRSHCRVGVAGEPAPRYICATPRPTTPVGALHTLVSGGAERLCGWLSLRLSCCLLLLFAAAAITV